MVTRKQFIENVRYNGKRYHSKSFERMTDDELRDLYFYTKQKPGSAQKNDFLLYLNQYLLKHNKLDIIK